MAGLVCVLFLALQRSDNFAKFAGVSRRARVNRERVLLIASLSLVQTCRSKKDAPMHGLIFAFCSAHRRWFNLGMRAKTLSRNYTVGMKSFSLFDHRKTAVSHFAKVGLGREISKSRF